MTSVDIGLMEGENTPVGSSIALEGAGAAYADFAGNSWALHNNPAGGLGATKGTINHNQVLIHPTNAFAGLSLSKESPAGPIEAGSNITYTITVSNSGPFAATSVRVNDTLPAGFSFVSGTPSQGLCTISNHTVTCFLLTIVPGTNATISIEATAVLGGTFTNSATVTATRPDSNLTDNVATTVTTVMTPVDTDGDGMPDWWEEKHQSAGLNPAVSNAPTSDVDNDGVPDIDEYGADTDPGDDQDFLKIDEFGTDGGTNSVQFESSAARKYTGESSTNLNSGSWTNFTGKIPGSGGTLTLTDTNHSPQGFYRVGAEVP